MAAANGLNMSERQPITGFSNPKVKTARALREKKHRKREGRFLVEGLRLVTEALDAGFVPEEIWLSARRDEHPLIDRVERSVAQADGAVYETTPDILSKISGKDNPQALVAIFRDFSVDLQNVKREAAPIWLVAQALRDPGNLGTILRTGDAVGAGGLILVDDCTDPFSVEAVRASMGAIFSQTVAHSSWTDFIRWLRAGPGQLVGTSLATEHDYQDPEYSAPSFILVGNEARGLPAEYAAECDLLVKIPMLGKADSLNAAMACAIMSYEVLNQIRRKR